MTPSERILGKVLARTITRGTLAISWSDGSRSTFGTTTPGFPDVAARMLDDRVARDTLTDMRLGFAEAFMDGRVVIEQGDILALVELARRNSPWDEGRDLSPPSIFRQLRQRLGHYAHSFNRPDKSRKNVAHHYDIGNGLYQLMLDEEHMQYSCAYWDTERFGEDMTLGQAQEAKLAHIAAKLNLRPGLRVLDIGSGWGGMAIFLAQRARVEVLGITLSEEQLALARERAEAAGVADRVRFELLDYRVLADRKEQFDRIVSVGMFEHVGQPQFTTFFRACARLLTEDGTMLLHTIGRMGSPSRTDAFTDKWIFPGGYIPALSETVAASEKVRLIAADVETLRLHYARTIREWYARVVEHRDAIIAMHDERFYRLWTFYLAGAATSFESGAMCNYQIQYVRNRRALPFTRNYMADAERALLSGPAGPEPVRAAETIR